MKKYRTILWDLDQTLLDFTKSQSYALRYTFDKLSLEITDQIIDRYADINDSYWKRYERGEITKDEVLIGRFITLFEELHITHIKAEEIHEIYQETLGSIFYFLEDADRLVAILKEKGFRQYIVTNGVNKTQERKVKLSGLDLLVDGVFVSELIGHPKPHKEFFDACFTYLAKQDTESGRGETDRIKKENCILVGDSLTSDMTGGMNAGIDTCWYNPLELHNRSEVKVTYEIKSLWELPVILGIEI